MTTTPFDWIVDEYDEALKGDPKLAAKISDWLGTHSERSAVARSTSKYDTELSRLAYTLADFAMGVSTVRTVLRSLPSRRPFPQPYTVFRNSLNIVSLGSGPGSDLVGCLLSLGAVPRDLALYAADQEDGWKAWVEAAVDGAVATDPLLAASKPRLNFDRLDLNDTAAVKTYVERFRHEGPTVFVMHRVLGTAAAPEELADVLSSDLLPDEAMLVVVAPVRDAGHLGHLADLLDKRRRGWVKRHDCGLLIHHGWTIPEAIWKPLTHKPEVQAEYDALVAMRDLVATLPWPEAGLESKRQR